MARRTTEDNLPSDPSEVAMSDRIPTVAERLEAASLEALHAGASDTLRDRLDLSLEWIEGAMVSMSTDPSILLNRTMGLGMRDPATREGIEHISEAYRAHGIERFYLGIHPDADPRGIERILEGAGLKTGRGWVKFERGSDPAPTADSDLAVRAIGKDHVEEFGRIVTSGFGLTPDASPLFRGLIDRPGVRLYMTFDGNTPAGAGLVYIDGDCAWFDWTATAPEFRRRGSQRALLSQRIGDALDAGCTSLLTCTGEAVPGDAQHSYHNIEWAGFTPTYVRANWVPR